MDNFDLEELLCDQYREELTVAYESCFHTGTFFAGEFNGHLNTIWSYAKSDGISEDIFQDMVNEVADRHVDSIIYPFPTITRIAA